MMKITALLENTTTDPALTPKHGLSVYIETAKHKTLFDLGPDYTSLNNAQKMGIDLTQVDTVVLSHGHYDHGGGLAGFLKMNSDAKLYFHRNAFQKLYHKRLFLKKYIGLDQRFAGSDRITLIGDTLRIDDELFIFSDVTGQLDTKSSRSLFKKTSEGYARDDFSHEQSLIVTSDNKTALFSGCSHRGISNILRAANRRQPSIDYVFGGFHLFNPATKAVESPEMVGRLAAELSEQNTVYYTCHCTGEAAFEIMSGIMGDKVRYLSTGTVVETD